MSRVESVPVLGTPFSSKSHGRSRLSIRMSTPGQERDSTRGGRQIVGRYIRVEVRPARHCGDAMCVSPCPAMSTYYLPTPSADSRG
eukprot:1795491-Rhodomonas_salina.1